MTFIEANAADSAEPVVEQEAKKRKVDKISLKKKYLN